MRKGPSVIQGALVLLLAVALFSGNRLNGDNAGLRARLSGPAIGNRVNGSSGWANADLVLFYLPTCPTCRKVDALLRSVEAKRPELKVVRIDVTETSGQALQASIAGRYRVAPDQLQSVPELLLVKSGRFLVDPERIRNALQTASPSKTAVSASPGWKPCDETLRSGCSDDSPGQGAVKR